MRTAQIFGRLHWLTATRQVSTLLGLAMIGLLWFGLQFQLASERHAALETAQQSARNLTRAFEEHVVRTIEEVDEALILLRATHERYRLDWQSIVSVVGRLNELTLQISAIDRNGHLIASNVSQGTGFDNIGLDLSDREHFKVHAGGGMDKLFISRPVLGRVSQRWSIQLTRPVRAPDGAFDGVLVISLDPNRISEFYKSIDVGEHGVVSLVGSDGVIRARASRDGHDLGANQKAAQEFRKGLVGRSGSFTLAETSDGIERDYFYREVRNLPFFVTIAYSRQEILKDYFQHRIVYSMGGLLLTLLVLAAMTQGVRHHRLIEQAAANLRRSEEETRRKSKELEVTLNNMSQGILMVDANHDVAVMNQQVVRMLELPASIVSERLTIKELVAYQAEKGEFEGDLGFTDPQVLEGLRNGAVAPVLAKFERRRPNGSVLEVSTKNLPGGGFVRTFTDITERKRSEAQMAYMAEHDALTCLPNRVLLKKELERVLVQQKRYGEGFAVLYFDLDKFKPVNDTLGHPVGDALLSAVAQRLKNCVRESDTLARLGGDEFAVLQLGVRQPADCVALAEKIGEIVSAPYLVLGHNITIGVSIGIAMAPQDGEDADQLIRNADLALYRVKENGRGDYCFFEPGMDSEARKRRELEIDLRNGLQNNEFQLYYQPIVQIDTGAVTGFEALLRWIHPVRGMVSPADFIPIAEEIGFIVPLGEWVLRQACKMAMTLPDPIKMAVNLSAAQFKSTGLTQTVAAVLAETGLAPERLELEITESVLLDDSTRNMDTLYDLRYLGVGISLDDFGTGYSSLGYLRTFPFDKIKIDRSFVMELEEREDCAAIVRAVTGLGKNLGMITTAEGVETEHQLSELKAQGCIEAQGYLFSPPRPASEAIGILAARSPQMTKVA